MTRLLLFLLIGVAFVSPASAQWAGCQCKFSNGGTRCMNHLPSFTCPDTCTANLSPGVTVQSADEVPSCNLEALHPGTYATLVEHTRYSICHQGMNAWTGSNGDVPLHGEALRSSIIAGQADRWKGQAQGFKEVQEAPVQDLDRALGEAIERCKTEGQGPNFSEHLRWVWGHEAKSGALYAAGQRKDYFSDQGVCHIFNNTQHDDNVRNICAAFSGPEIQRILDSFGQPVKEFKRVREPRS